MSSIGIDVGGTFMDIVHLSDDGTIRVDKIPSSPEPRVLVDAVSSFVSFDSLKLFALGTTVGTNALIERNGARTALIATRGFRDVLELRRTNKGDLYDLQWDPPSPLIRRANRLEITERVGSDGRLVTPVNEGEELDRLVRIIKKRGIESVAIVFLHSYLDGQNERRLRDLLASRCPDLDISISCEVLPMYREFERATTVAANAYLAPVMRQYFRELRSELEERGYAREVQVMQSNGGLASLESAAATPAKLIRSGPSAGSVALEELAEEIKSPNIIGLDIGGTSADVSLVWQGRSKLADRVVPEWGLPVLLPSLDIISIGAGGGSIARIDAGGSLVVGPESAGSDPGPACYGRGGELPTSTDAQVVLGRLGTQLVGGELALDPTLSQQALLEHVGDPLGMDATDSAAGVLEILTDTMMRAVRIVTIERGYDPRDFVLCGFGGSGPMYAVDIARGLSIPQVVVPCYPGVFSAYGLLRSDVVYDATRSILREIQPGEVDEVEKQLQGLEMLVSAQFERDGFLREDIRFRRIGELLYSEQMHELSIDLGSPPFTADSLTKTLSLFHEEHLRTYGHNEPEDSVSFVNLKVLGEKPRTQSTGRRVLDLSLEDPIAEMREVYFRDTGWVSTQVSARNSLKEGSVIEGPALLTQVDTTIVLPPGSKAEVLETGDIMIDVGAS